jgi:RND superfamily putative drug exporter
MRAMSSHLYRLGGWAFAHRRRVLATWSLILAAVAVSAALFSSPFSTKFEVPGTESQRAQDLLHAKFPGAGGAAARMVFAAPDGQTLTAGPARDTVMRTVRAARAAAGVSFVSDPYAAHTISADGRIGYADVVYPVPADQIGRSARDALFAVGDPARAAGIQVEFGGDVVDDGGGGSSEGIGLLIGLLVLAITLGSLVAAGLPLLTAILGVAITVAGVTALTSVLELNEMAPTLGTMLGLAVGIDYALFILSRHRQHLTSGMTPAEAAARATATAGSAVVFAGLTVVVALAGLAVVNIPFLTVMGLGAALAVVVAVLIALTLLPALLGFAGTRIVRTNRVLAWRPRPARSTRESTSVRFVRAVTRRPLPVLLGGVVVLLALAVPATHLELGLPDAGSRPSGTTERQAYDLLTEGFGPGANGVLTVVVDAPGVPRRNQARLAQTAVDRLERFPQVAAVSPPVQNERGDVTIVNVTPKGGPSSDPTRELVTALRAAAASLPRADGVTAYVTGTTAVNIDTADRLAHALPKYVAVVVGLALLLLTFVFRSILVPIKAATGFLLSVAASMGLVVWVFQDGHLADALGVAHTGPVVSFLPVLLIGILFGLAMDYEVFLVSRIREAYRQSGDAQDAIITGYGQSGRVVTAAALIMTGVFAAFLLDPDPVIKSIGFSLAAGVLLDAFVVRMTLVPAAMALMGHYAWRLPRSLPRGMRHERPLPHPHRFESPRAR